MGQITAYYNMGLLTTYYIMGPHVRWDQLVGTTPFPPFAACPPHPHPYLTLTPHHTHLRIEAEVALSELGKVPTYYLMLTTYY